MPLIQSGSKPALVENAKRELKAGKPRDQAWAIAYDVKRRNRADGGPVFDGPIVSEVPGRTDRHGIAVGSGSYVWPAEAVSHLGENNTLAGLAHLKKIGPQGIRKMAHSAPGASGIIARHRRKRAAGGGVDQPIGQPIDIIAAGGEHVMSPQDILVVGDGDVQLGHALMDNLILQQRKKHIKTLKALKPPAKD